MWLATALYGAGEPLDAALVALERSWTLAKDTGDETRTRQHACIDVLRGDLDGAARRLATWDGTAEADDETQFEMLLFRARLELERGDTKAAGDLADAYLARRGAWVSDGRDDYAIYGLGLEYLADRISVQELTAGRDRWLARQPPQSTRTNTLATRWMSAFAFPARSHEDGQAALAALPRFEAPRRAFARMPLEEEAIGRATLLAGDVAGAVPHLRTAAHSCWGVFAPIEETRAALELGNAYEQSGRRADACTEYARVAARWGAARASTTAAEARARQASLRCAVSDRP
jgi:hypothetical protein